MACKSGISIPRKEFSSLRHLAVFMCKQEAGQTHKASALLVLLLCLHGWFYGCVMPFQIGLNLKYYMGHISKQD